MNVFYATVSALSDCGLFLLAFRGSVWALIQTCWTQSWHNTFRSNTIVNVLTETACRWLTTVGVQVHIGKRLINSFIGDENTSLNSTHGKMGLSESTGENLSSKFKKNAINEWCLNLNILPFCWFYIHYLISHLKYPLLKASVLRRKKTTTWLIRIIHNKLWDFFLIALIIIHYLKSHFQSHFDLE